MEKWAPRDYSSRSSSQRFHLVLPASILEEELAEANAAMKAKEETMTKGGLSSYRENHHDDDDDEEEEHEEQGEEDLDHDELLRRARSRLLEDLSQGNLNGDKGVLTLPHSLAKYKEVRPVEL
jgi:hypothetical protein